MWSNIPALFKRQTHSVKIQFVRSNPFLFLIIYWKTMINNWWYNVDIMFQCFLHCFHLSHEKGIRKTIFPLNDMSILASITFTLLGYLVQGPFRFMFQPRIVMYSLQNADHLKINFKLQGSWWTNSSLFYKVHIF